MSATESLPVASPRQARAELWRALQQQRRGAWWVPVTLLIAAAAGLVIPPALGAIVDVAHQGGTRTELVVPLLVLASAIVVEGVASGAGWYLMVRFGESVLAVLRERVLGHALLLPQTRLERSGTGDLVSRVSNDVRTVSEALREGVPELLWSGVTVVLTAFGLAALDWRFAVAGLVSAPCYVWAVHGYTVVAPPLYLAEREAEGARSQQLVETLGGVRTIVSLLLGPRHTARVEASSEQARRASIRAVDRTAWFWSRMHLGELTGTGAVLLVGAWLVGNGEATLGTATAAALYFIRLYDPIGALVYLLDDVQSATASLRRLSGILQVPLDERTGADVPTESALVLRGVRFGYDDGAEVLHGIDLVVSPGEHVALVGASGAGKTTLARLVAGVHEPDAGVIELGGAALRDLSRASLSARIALVTQDVHVFAGTLAQDLRLARPDASDEELRAALDMSGAGAWAALLPEGLDTVVGTGGHTLTPVQAQQLALARLVLRDPDVAVLDEATAEAGSAGARELEAHMSRVLQGRTALLVAHRLTTAASSDRVVLMEHGRIVEEGPPGELAAGDGPYAELWRAWSAVR